MSNENSHEPKKETSSLKKIWKDLKNTTQEWGDNDPIHIQSYLTYAHENEIYIKGRVLEDEGFSPLNNSSKWNNFVRNIRYIESDEIPALPINIDFNGKTYHTLTNHDGYFEFKIERDNKADESNSLSWHSAKVTAPSLVNDKGEMLSTMASILWPNQNTQYIIVSDIDDTILKTNVSSFLKLKLLYNTFFENAHTRLPFPGIAKTLNNLQKNEAGNIVNPIFYLSHSPWNLYPYLIEFMEHNNIPKGPLFLRDLGFKTGIEKQEHNQHKKIQLNSLLKNFSQHPMVLIGDASENDANIYLNLYMNSPERIKVIFIRETGIERKDNKVKALQNSHPEAPLFLIKDSHEIENILKNLLK